MKIYLAGPMTGLPDENFPAFNAAAKWLRSFGHEVFNPAENGSLDDPFNTYRKCLRVDLDWICDYAEGIAMLPGWEQSKGARTEHTLAQALGLEFMYLGMVVAE